ncbi:hypothetical protein LEQ41_03565 [Streptococcus agalactiae]|nr:hypothetical protein [Streptococcus agalactiae]
MLTTLVLYTKYKSDILLFFLLYLLRLGQSICPLNQKGVLFSSPNG